MCEEHEDIFERDTARVEAEGSLLKKRMPFDRREDRMRQHQAAFVVRGGEIVTVPQTGTEYPSKRKESAIWVIENIKAAPVAYFKFASLSALVCFAFCVVFYRAFDAIIINPVFAIYGAVGSLLSWLLATASNKLIRR
jgi:hypothetical protein